MPRIKLFANLRQAAGLKKTQVTGATIGETLGSLTMAYPVLGPLLIENNRLRPHVILTVNGQTTLDLSAPVAEDDEIAIFPPIAGG